MPGLFSFHIAILPKNAVTTVYTVERLQGLALSAHQRLEKLGYDNIFVQVADGTLGWPEHAPYDAIVVTAGAPRVPWPLLEQLAVGGRLVIPVGASSHVQKLLRVRRTGRHDYHSEDLCGVRFVPLIGAEGW